MSQLMGADSHHFVCSSGRFFLHLSYILYTYTAIVAIGKFVERRNWNDFNARFEKIPKTLRFVI